MKMTGFVQTRRVKVIPWNRGGGTPLEKRPSRPESWERGFPRDPDDDPSDFSRRDERNADSKDDADIQRRPNVYTIWKVALFIILVTALALYAKAHWPGVTAVFSLKSSGGLEVATGQDQDFFIEFRLDREKTEKEQVDLVKKVMDDQTASKEARDAATAHYLSIVDVMGKELKIEGILKAKGWDTLVFLSPDACTVVVKTTRLEIKDVAQIGDVVKRMSKIKLENVTIIPVEK